MGDARPEAGSADLARYHSTVQLKHRKHVEIFPIRTEKAIPVAFVNYQYGAQASTSRPKHDMGRLDRLEDWCLDDKCLSFAGRMASWKDLARSAWLSQESESQYPILWDEDDEIVVEQPMVEHLGSIEAPMHQFDAADYIAPQLAIDRSKSGPSGSQDDGRAEVSCAPNNEVRRNRDAS